MSAWRRSLRGAALAAVLVSVGSDPLSAQTPAPVIIPPSSDPSVTALAAQLQEIRSALAAVQQELAVSRRESQELREALQALQGPSASGAQVGASAAADPDEERELLNAKLDDLEQSKVESGSRYHVRLSGMALLNVVGTTAPVDSLDVPLQAVEPSAPVGGAIAAGLRQSFLTVSMFGPTVGGARTAGELSLDFFGGFPGTTDGLSASFARLRTARLAFEWRHTSVVAGQDTPFFSPLTPTSLASAAYPSLSGAGNVWAWAPELFVEQRVPLRAASQLVLQAGLIDPMTGELPASEYTRTPTAGERTYRPAEAARIAFQRVEGRRVAAGAAVYHSRQDWGHGRRVGAWAVSGDVDIATGPWLSWSGEVYRGRAIGGLGGGLSSSVLFQGPVDVASTPLLAVDSTGGWGQLKVKPRSRFQVNFAAGADSPFRTGLPRLLAAPFAEGGVAARNTSAFVNAIYQARSNVLFSLEVRRLWTTPAGAPRRSADHVSVTSGFAF